MTPVTVTNVDELRRLVGTPIGPRWIHTDSERARRESPFGGPVAHGNLTLAMIDGFREQLVDSSDFQLDINYGFNKVRFPAPGPVGSKLRAILEVLGIDAVAVGWQVLQRVTVEIDGSAKPACVAESVDILIA